MGRNKPLPSRKRAVPPTAERDVLPAVLEALALLGIDAQRQNTAAFLNAKGRQVRCGVKGNPDITATLPDGRRLEIEVKRPGKRPSPEQYKRLRTLLAQGAVAFWTDDAGKCLSALRRILDGWGVEIDDDGNPWVVSPDETTKAPH